MLRLLQMKNSEEVLKKMIEVSETYTNINDNSWRLEGKIILSTQNISGLLKKQKYTCASRQYSAFRSIRRQTTLS